MRYGIISDVHGNTEALKACLDALDARGVDRIACLGDIVGYGAEPNQCCDLLRERVDFMVLGNHDAMATGRLSDEWCHAQAQRAIHYTMERLSEENRQWLSSLDYKSNHNDICFCHGSPINSEEFEYVFNLDQAALLTESYDDLARVTFVGHSHRTTAFVVTRHMALQVSAPRLVLRDGVKYVINVGSVGQPRDRDNRSCCVVYDTSDQSVEFVRLDYDIQSAADKIIAAELPSAFGQRLYHGV
jgi:predicted phosphodiesterase